MRQPASGPIMFFKFQALPESRRVVGMAWPSDILAQSTHRHASDLLDGTHGGLSMDHDGDAAATHFYYHYTYN